MNFRKMTSIAFVLGSVALFWAFGSANGHPKPLAAGHGDWHSEKNCVPVGGTVMTNFGAIDANTTLGLATGDLRGAVAATLLNAPQRVGNNVAFHVQHHWVTESGDMISVDPATATTAPVAPNVFAVLSYPVHITGGTGRFAGATGDLTNIGVADLNKLQTIFRYSGQVCFAEQEEN